MNYYYVYVITNNNKSYVGSTNNLQRRIRQHNCEIKGGAKYTTSVINSKQVNGKQENNKWQYKIIIGTFDHKTALSFEWHLKHGGKGWGIKKRLDSLEILRKNDKYKNWYSIIKN